MEANQSDLPNRRHCVLIVVIGVTALDFIFSTMIFASLSLTRFVNEEEDYVHGLMTCYDCPSFYQDTTYSCLATIECEGNNEELCDAGTKLHLGQQALFVLEVLHCLCLFLLFHRTICSLTHRGGSSALACFCLGLGQAVFKGGAVAIFFGAGSISFSSSCDEGDVCGEIGAIVLLVSVFVSVLNLVLGCVLFRQRGAVHPHVSRRPSPSKLQSQTPQPIFLKLLCGQSVFVVLILVSFVVPWVSFETEAEYEGYLFTVSEYAEYEDIQYSCLEHFACLHADSAVCNDIRDVWDAGEFYCLCALVSVAMMLQWIEAAFYSYQNQPYGFRTVNFIMPWASWLCYFIGFLGWILNSKARFSADCKAHGDELQACMKVGPLIALSVCVGSFIMALRYSWIGGDQSQRLIQQHSSVSQVRSIAPMESLDNTLDVLWASQSAETKGTNKQFGHAMGNNKKNSCVACGKQ